MLNCRPRLTTLTPVNPVGCERTHPVFKTSGGQSPWCGDLSFMGGAIVMGLRSSNTRCYGDPA